MSLVHFIIGLITIMNTVITLYHNFRITKWTSLGYLGWILTQLNRLLSKHSFWEQSLDIEDALIANQSSFSILIFLFLSLIFSLLMNRIGFVVIINEQLWWGANKNLLKILVHQRLQLSLMQRLFFSLRKQGRVTWEYKDVIKQTFRPHCETV